MTLDELTVGRRVRNDDGAIGTVIENGDEVVVRFDPVTGLTRRTPWGASPDAGKVAHLNPQFVALLTKNWTPV